MNKKRNANLTPFSQALRRDMTKEERHLWYDFLRRLPVTVNRQKVIGPYIVDFYCCEAGLVIELDGSQHYEEAGIAADRERDAYLSGLGLTVARYSNSDVGLNFQGVCADILERMEKAPHPTRRLARLPLKAEAQADAGHDSDSKN